jgi:hypothetical protein
VKLIIVYVDILKCCGKVLSLLILFFIPVGIPSTLEPRPNPLITGPLINHGSIGKVPSIPEQEIYKQVI